MVIQVNVKRNDGTGPILLAEFDARTRFLWVAAPGAEVLPEDGVPGAMRGLVVEPNWTEGGPAGEFHWYEPEFSVIAEHIAKKIKQRGRELREELDVADMKEIIQRELAAGGIS